MTDALRYLTGFGGHFESEAVDGALPVREGHRIAHDVKDALLAANLNVLDALHYE